MEGRCMGQLDFESRASAMQKPRNALRIGLSVGDGSSCPLLKTSSSSSVGSREGRRGEMRELRMGNAEEAAMERQMIRRAVEDCPRLAQDEKERIDKVARFVARDGDLTETILLRLLKITKNQRRWGFISPDHPHHGYYLRRKISEQCRAIRPPRHMVITARER